MYVTENPHVQPGSRGEPLALGVHDDVRRQLASAHVAVPHARLAALGRSRGRPPRRRASRCTSSNTVLVFVLLVAHDGRVWRSALVAGALRPPPAARRVGGLGRGAEGRPQHVPLVPHDARVRGWVRARPARGATRSSRSGLALGLMAKPMLVTLPFTLLLLDYWPLGRLRTRAALRPLVREKLPLVRSSRRPSVVTMLAQTAGGALGDARTLPARRSASRTRSSRTRPISGRRSGRSARRPLSASGRCAVAGGRGALARSCCSP